MPSTAAGQPVLTAEWVRPKVIVALESAAPADKRVPGRLARLTFEYDCADTMGVNRRIYPSELMAPAAAVLNEEASQGMIFGRLDHPNMDYYGRDGADALRVTMRDAAFRVVSAEMVGKKTLKVVADVADNPHGQQLMSLYAVGGDPGISYRSLAYWDTLSPEEKTRYAVPQDESAEIARSLRLVTLDIVSKPGFPDAKGAARTEQEDLPMDIATFRAQHPQLLASIETAARAAGKAEAEQTLAKQVTVALEDARPKIIEEATKPLNTELATLRAENAKLRKLTTDVAAAMGAAGVATGEAADASLKVRLTTMETEAAATKTAMETAKAEAAKAKSDLETERKTRLEAECAAAVAEQFKAHPFADDIKAAAKGCTDKTDAIAKATAEAARIDRIRGAKVGTGKARTEANPAGSDKGGKGDEDRELPTAEAATGRAMASAMFENNGDD